MTADELREKVALRMRELMETFGTNEHDFADAAVKICMEAAETIPQSFKEIALEKSGRHMSKQNFCITMDEMKKAFIHLTPESDE